MSYARVSDVLYGYSRWANGGNGVRVQSDISVFPALRSRFLVAGSRGAPSFGRRHGLKAKRISFFLVLALRRVDVTDVTGFFRDGEEWSRALSRSPVSLQTGVFPSGSVFGFSSLGHLLIL